MAANRKVSEHCTFHSLDGNINPFSVHKSAQHYYVYGVGGTSQRGVGGKLRGVNGVGNSRHDGWMELSPKNQILTTVREKTRDWKCQ